VTLGKTWRLKKKGGERVGTGELLRCGVQVDLLAQPWVAPPRVDLYSNSTVALGVEIGRLARYYQYLPGGDWDLDHTHERVVAHAHRSRSHGGEWINSKIPRGQADSQNNGSREMAPQWS
jgi:hypothetical protein